MAGHKAGNKPASRKARKRGKQDTQQHSRRLYKWPVLVFVAAFLIYLVYLNQIISNRFDGDTWAIPSRVFARPLELYPGLPINIDELVYELDLSTYQPVRESPQTGQYKLEQMRLELHTRRFEFSHEIEPRRHVKILFSGDQIERIVDLQSGQSIEILRLPPVIIGSYHPDNGEDRLLLSENDIPPKLVDILIAVEDRRFYQHFGINPVSIFRALIENIKAGRTVQGGSTITQQLAKNLFLTPERSLLRKINEAFMALLLEIRFNKKAILVAYLNEVFLLQQNNISIHGFAQASRMLFKQTVDQLSTDKLALLVGMVKGPSHYNPVVNPQQSLTRRNLVLAVMRDQNIIDDAELKELSSRPLGAVDHLPPVNRFPAYLDLVKRQLSSNYDSRQLAASGLQIYTSFDPSTQQRLEEGLKAGLNRYDQAELQAAVIITNYLSGEIKALTGDRQVDFPGFNRAIMAQRPIGSLIKPLLLYSLLESNNYSLATLVKDKPVRIKQSNGDIWEPENYDRELHGEMSLYQAFVKSYNLPFVNLGVNGGLELLADNLQKIKLLKHDIVYPSLLLGTTAMSVFEVAQMYQVIANNGYFSPITTIRQVTDADNNILSTNHLDSVKLFDQETSILVQRAMIGVAEEGTARYLKQRFRQKNLAGKTGTTNDARDSWFSGFTDQLLTVVWLGRDDNTPVGLSGSAGALRVWADIMDRVGFSSFKLAGDDNLAWRHINPLNAGLSREDCDNSVLLPFKKNQVPRGRAICAR
jgi:penicillin-binding protein 1B